MQNQFTAFRRGNVWYFEDRESGKQKILKTRDEAEARRILHPIRFAGCSVSSRRGRDGTWHVSVRVDKTEFALIKNGFLKLATTTSVEFLMMRFRGLRFVRYSPAMDQYRILLRAVNRRRKIAGLELVPKHVLPERRQIVWPFG